MAQINCYVLGPRPSPPINVSVSAGDGGIRIKWRAPLNTTVPIFWYSVEYSVVDNEWEQAGATDGVDTSFLFTLGHPGATYRFRVYANALLAYSVPSAVVSYTVPEGDYYDVFFCIFFYASLSEYEPSHERRNLRVVQFVILQMHLNSHSVGPKMWILCLKLPLVSLYFF